MNPAQMLWVYLTANVAVVCSECECSVVSMTESPELSSNLSLTFHQWMSHLSTSQRVCTLLYSSGFLFSLYIMPFLIYVHLNVADISLLQLLLALADMGLNFEECIQLSSCYVMYWALLCTCRFPQQQISELNVEYACIHYCPPMVLLDKERFPTAVTSIEYQWSRHLGITYSIVLPCRCLCIPCHVSYWRRCFQIWGGRALPGDGGGRGGGSLQWLEPSRSRCIISGPTQSTVEIKSRDSGNGCWVRSRPTEAARSSGREKPGQVPWDCGNAQN